MTRSLLAASALVGVVVALELAIAPARPLRLDSSWTDGTVAGLVHVHTNRSDGRDPPDLVAAAAARAGLKFLVFTDHGDAMRAPDPPTYRAGVLCLDGVEISTNGGHYLALDMNASPYPLGGDARDVVDDVRRLGGFGVAAHPDSPKPELQWRDWQAPIDALEIINPDTSWRVRLAQAGWRSRGELARALFTYPLRPSETIAGLLTDIAPTLEEWQRLTAERRVVGILGADAHAKLELRNLEPGDNRYALPFPAYDSSFRALSIRVRLERAWSGDAPADARVLMDALRRGNLYTVVDAWATPPAFEFTALHSGGTAREGDEIGGSGPISLHVRSNLPGGYSTTVWEGSQEIAQRTEQDFRLAVGDHSAVYRIEIRSDHAIDRPPWIVSNPIYVRRSPRAVVHTAPPRSVITARAGLFDGRTESGWTAEADKTSLAAIDVAPALSGNELRFRYGLSGGSAIGQFAAAVVQTPTGVASYTRIRFSGRAERPMRVSVQARADSGGRMERWQRSVYMETAQREQTVTFDDMTPVGQTNSAHPPLGNVRSLILAVDTTNSRPGSSGRIWLQNVTLETEARSAR